MADKKREHIFTPFGGDLITEGLDDMGRIRMILGDEDYAKIQRGGPWQAVVKDVATGRIVRVRDADCGAPHCR